jgi:hypothetical protein
LEVEVRPEEWARTPTAAGTVKHSRVIQVVMEVVQEEIQVYQVQAVVVEEPQQ